VGKGFMPASKSALLALREIEKRNKGFFSVFFLFAEVSFFSFSRVFLFFTAGKKRKSLPGAHQAQCAFESKQHACHEGQHVEVNVLKAECDEHEAHCQSEESLAAPVGVRSRRVAARHLAALVFHS